MPVELLGKSLEELRALLAEMGEPAYRGAQIYHALYAERRFDVAAMSNLPAKLRERLAQETSITLPQISQRYRSADGSVRYLLSLEPIPGAQPSGAASLAAASLAFASLAFARDKRDKRDKQNEQAAPIRTQTRSTTIEAVFMPSEDRQTICISTQAGCAVDCRFCLTATLGLIRNLTAGEIIGQVLAALEDNRAALKPQTNIVLMGQGEPLLNYDAVLAAVRILLDASALAISPKHVTLSTCGIVPGIERLAQETVRPKLAISLNASSDEQRDAIMPINKKYPLRALLAACRKYPLRTWERLTFEYVLLGGFNDTADDARRVVRLLNRLRSKVNVIPWNPGELPYAAPSAERIEEFRRILADKGVPAFVRYSRGQDIMAACGQLALVESRQQSPTVQISV